jgi:histidine triad (HIT) family protein
MQNDVFSKIIREEIPCKKIYETDTTLVFYDINPVAKIHALAIPKNFYLSMDDFLKNSNAKEMYEFWTDIEYAANTILKLNGEYRILSNSGEDSGQEIPYFHVHILNGLKNN